MSTKSTALFSTPVPTVLLKEVASGLCPFIKELPGLRVSVRPLCIATDVPVVYKWLCREYAGPLLSRNQPPHELEESYACMIESDFAQPFMGLINDVPVCQVDVYKTQQDAISLYYNARPGDYGIQLVLAPLAIQQNMILLVRTCLEYFFSFPEVGRIIADIDIANEWNHTLFKKAGFRSAQKIQTPYKSSTLLICTRASFNIMH